MGLSTVLDGSPLNPIVVGTNVNSYSATYIQNKSAGTSASADFTAGNNADDGTVATGHYVDMGINSSTYNDGSFTIGAANDAYLVSTGGDLAIVSQTATKKIKVATGGTLAANERARFDDTGLIVMPVTAVPAGGTAATGLRFSSTANLGVFFGSGVPTLSAAQGSLYLRTDGSSIATRLYVNTNGTTGWTNMVTAA